ncbi:MAG: thermonuclease family protein [Pseudomonadota bacterium]
MSFSHPPDVISFEKHRRRKRRRGQWLPLLVIGMLLQLVLFAVMTGNHTTLVAWAGTFAGNLNQFADLKPGKPSAYTHKATFPLCNGGLRYTCTVDGDTVWYKGEKFRLSGIDAPETFKPRCREERRLGERAKRRLASILSNNAWSIERQGIDRYGRTLARFRIGNKTVGDMLVKERLAKRWQGRKARWCANA